MNELDALRYLDGPWRNDACIGYTVMAMERAGLKNDAIKRVIHEMKWCFDDTSVDEAATYYLHRGGI